MSTITFTLSAEAGVRDIDQIWAALSARLREADPLLEVDAEAVLRPDTALAQMLAVAVVRAREQGKSVKIVRASQRLRELLSLLGLDVALDMVAGD